MMSQEDPGILCFEHCSGRRVFCIQLPEYCPVCRAHILTESGLIPFRIPYPFVKASQHSFSIVIKPTNGDFLNDYQLSSDLHIGVTTRKGQTVEFDREGLSMGRDWPDCLLIHQLDTNQEEVVDEWETTLQQVSSFDSWTSLRYNEDTFNCYTFVLAFLRCLKYPPLTEAAKSKTIFCEKFVSPRAEMAWKYIKLCRRVQDSGYYVSKPQI